MKRKLPELEDQGREHFIEISKSRLVEEGLDGGDERITESLTSFYNSMSEMLSGREERIMTEVIMVFSALREVKPENDAFEQLIEILSTCANSPDESMLVLSNDELSKHLIKHGFVTNFSSLVELHNNNDIFEEINSDLILRFSRPEYLGPERLPQIITLITNYSEILENISSDIIVGFLKSKDADYPLSSNETIESIASDIDSYIELELDKITNITPNRTMGVEIEFCYQEDQLPLLVNGWEGKDDKSIEPYLDYDDGREYISPILENRPGGLDPLVEQLRSLCYSTAYTNSSCGLHIHIGVTNVEDTNEERLNFIKQITINYLALESQGLAFPKRENEFNSLLADIGDDSDMAAKVEKIKNSGTIEELMQNLNLIDDKIDRSAAPVNLFSIMKHGTLEFRAHSGTVNPKDIASWTRCINDLVGLSQDMIKEREPRYPNLEDAQKIVRDLQDGNDHVIKKNESLELISSSPKGSSATTFLVRENSTETSH